MVAPVWAPAVRIVIAEVRDGMLEKPKKRVVHSHNYFDFYWDFLRIWRVWNALSLLGQSIPYQI